MTQPAHLPTYFSQHTQYCAYHFYPASPSSSCCILSSLIPLFPLFIVPNLIPSPNLPFKYLPTRGFPMVKWQSPPASAGDTGDDGSIPGSGRSPGGGNDNPLQYSCLGSPMDRGAWQATVHEVAKSDTTEQLSTHTLSHLNCCQMHSLTVFVSPKSTLYGATMVLKQICHLLA